MFMHFEADDIQVNDFIKIHAEVKAIKYLNVHGDFGTCLRIKDGEWIDFNKD